jgi:hypothetical protein
MRPPVDNYLCKIRDEFAMTNSKVQRRRQELFGTDAVESERLIVHRAARVTDDASFHLSILDAYLTALYSYFVLFFRQELQFDIRVQQGRMAGVGGRVGQLR